MLNIGTDWGRLPIISLLLSRAPTVAAAAVAADGGWRKFDRRYKGKS